MQQVQGFVWSVATGVEEATPLRSAATGGGGARHREVAASRRHPFPLPPSAIGRGCTPQFFLTFSLERFCSRVQYPLQAL